MMEDFVTKLSYETCNTVFESSDTDSKSVCPKCLLEDRLFKFSLNDGQKHNKTKTRITVEIKTSCKHKRELHFAS